MASARLSPVELKSDIFAHHVSKIALFDLFAKLDKGSLLLRNFCETVECALYSAGDELFSLGSRLHQTYVLVEGDMEYLQEEGCLVSPVPTGSWLACAAFWAQWKTRGAVEVRSDSKVLIIDPQTYSSDHMV